MATSYPAPGTPPSQLLARLQFPLPLKIQVDPAASADEWTKPTPAVLAAAANARIARLPRWLLLRIPFPRFEWKSPTDVSGTPRQYNLPVTETGRKSRDTGRLRCGIGE